MLDFDDDVIRCLFRQLQHHFHNSSFAILINKQPQKKTVAQVSNVRATHVFNTIKQDDSSKRGHLKLHRVHKMSNYEALKLDLREATM